jgi:hypothetical protein
MIFSVNIHYSTPSWPKAISLCFFWFAQYFQPWLRRDELGKRLFTVGKMRRAVRAIAHAEFFYLLIIENVVSKFIIGGSDIGMGLRLMKLQTWIAMDGAAH